MKSFIRITCPVCKKQEIYYLSQIGKDGKLNCLYCDTDISSFVKSKR